MASCPNIRNGRVMVVVRIEVNERSSSSNGAITDVSPAFRRRRALARRITGAKVSGHQSTGMKESEATMVPIQKVMRQPSAELETKPEMNGEQAGPIMVTAP